MAADPVTGGYRILGADGGVFTFDAPFDGSAIALVGAQRAVNISSSTTGEDGYLILGSDGTVWALGAASYWGSAS
jgi:hypothetical protein